MSAKQIIPAHQQAEKIAVHTATNLKELTRKIDAYSQQIHLGSSAWTPEEQLHHTSTANSIREELLTHGITAPALDLLKHSVIHA